MPENPNIVPDEGFDNEGGGFYGNNITMANTNANANANNNRNKSAGGGTGGATRVSSAGIKYYDIATQLLGKNGSDLEELFIAAARDGVYDRIENFLQRNRTEYVVSIDVKDKKTGNTPLIWAAKRGHAKIVQLLLRHGADITLRNYEGHTALEVGSTSIRSILLESVERNTDASHQLLLQAAWQGDSTVVKRLLSQRKVVDINCQNADGYTPVMLATRDMHLFERYSNTMSRTYNPVEVVSELLSARADLHATDGDGKSCLHHAASSKANIAHSVVSTIIEGAANLEQKDKRCFVPLHCASLTGNADCISSLLDGGSEINSRGFAGATALHITSYNNHEKATSVLLEHGANVTLTDDRGLTPLDFAKTRKMRKKLQEAWTDQTTTRSKTSLGPLIRTQSREDLRSSLEDLGKRKKGEVIFEGLPNNPFNDTTRNNSTLSNGKSISRHLSLKDKTGREEDQSQPHRDSVRRLGQVRNQQKPSPLPRNKSRSTERLPIISPDRTGSDRNMESPVMFGRNARARRSFEDRKHGQGRRAPLSTREGSSLGEEAFNRLSPGAGSPTPGVHHRRTGSDPNRGTPNLMEIAASCDPYLHAGPRRGRSFSMNSNHSIDTDSNRQSPNHGEFSPFQREATTMQREATTMQRDATQMSLVSYRTESRLSTNSSNNSPRMLLNLGQMLSKSKTPMQPMYGPGSSKVLPPSPAFITQRSGSNADVKSEMDISPRSDDESEVFRDKLSLPQELLRSRTIFKDEFVLEESRTKDNLMQSSGSDTISSSGSSQLSGSPRDSPLSMKGRGFRNANTTYNGVGLNQNTNNKVNQKGGVVVSNDKTATGNNATRSKSSMKYIVNGVGSDSQTSKAKVATTGNTVKSGTNNKASVTNTKTKASTSSGNVVAANKASTSNSTNIGVVNGSATVSNVNAKAGATAENFPSATNSKRDNMKSGVTNKTGGTILVHGDINATVDNVVNGSENVAKGNANSVNPNTGSNKATNSTSSVGNRGETVNNVDNKTTDKKKPARPPPPVPARPPPPVVRNDSNVTQTANSSNDKKLTSTSSSKAVPTQSGSGPNTSDKKTVQQTSALYPKRNQQKQMQGVLHVVPTKLTQNIIKSGTNANRDDTSAPKTISNKPSSKNIAGQNSTSTNSANNVNMQLSPSAQVQSRVAGQGNNNNTSDKKTSEGASKDTSASKTDANSGNKTANAVVVSNIKGPEKSDISDKNKSQVPGRQSSQSQQVQSVNRQGVQSRNSSFNTPKSAAVGVGASRQLSNVRKSTNSNVYSPRFQSSSANTNTKANTGASSSNQTNKTGAEAIKPVGSDAGIANSNKVTVKVDVKTAQQQGQNRKSSSDNSPTELVPPSVCKVASISKSYNMGPSPQVITKSHSNGSMNSDRSSGSNSDRAENNSRRHSILSKSVSDPIQNPANGSNSASIVNKGVAQMPSVGTVPSDVKSSAASKLLRSSSMSTIEEKKEKKLMSSSDTKLPGKQRPSSDGPVGATSINNKQTVAITKGATSTVAGSSTKPLVEILPEGTARVNRKSYMEGNNYTTPVIVNPFEELEQKREKERKLDGRALTATEFGFVVDKPSVERSKTQVSMKGRVVRVPRKGSTVSKTSTTQSRGSSARKKRSRSKDTNKSDSENTRPKSGKSTKRVRSGRRKKKSGVNLGKENEKDDIALIGGIGWQIATSCIDKSGADAVVVSQIDSSDQSDSECIDENSTTQVRPLHINIPDDVNLYIPNAIETQTPSSAHSPRFREVQPTFGTNPKEGLAHIDNDGYRPMNLDVTQDSSSLRNRSGVIIKTDMSGDMSDFLAQLHEEDEDGVFDDDYESAEDYDDEENYDSENQIHKQIALGVLTPIPESPSLSNTLNSRMSVHQTVEAALQRFDKNVNDDDLHAMLGGTPRNQAQLKSADGHHSKTPNDRVGSVTHVQSHSRAGVNASPGSATHSQMSPTWSNRDSNKTNSAQSKSGGPPSRNSSSRTGRTGSVNLSADSSTRDRSAKVLSSARSLISKPNSSSSTTHKPASGDVNDRSRSVSKSGGSLRRNYSNERLDKIQDTNDRSQSVSNKSGGSLRRSVSREKVDKSQDYESYKQSTRGAADSKNNSLKGSASNSATKARSDNNNVDLKKLLADKMQSTQQLLDRSVLHSASQRKNAANTNNGMVNTMPKYENMKIDIEFSDDVLDDEAKSTRSSRKERRFSETKNVTKEDDINEAIDEILSNTFPSTRSTLRSNHSFKSGNNTLTEADKSVLKKMVQEHDDSPFHAKGGPVTVSSSFDDNITLNKDNPALMRRFHSENYKVGQRVKAMVDAGADTAKVKAMVEVDNEAQQLAKIMNSFRQMELYAGTSHQRSENRNTPRRDVEHGSKHLSNKDRLELHHGHHSHNAGMPHHSHSHHHSGVPPRPGSAGAGRGRPGKFTEIKVKGGKSANVEKRDRVQSPVNVPKDLAEEFKRSPFVRVSSQQEMQEPLDELAQVIYNRADSPESPDSDTGHINLVDSDHERADSACTSLSSHSSIYDMEDTIQWKKGNVLGKGAFGTVWCGLTSEGQLIAVKQIELNTTNHNKAKKEYEKVQEEVELLKTLEHKNIVGYLGTSLEDSIVSIFMQFVPGGSIASILARFGALDEAVFRKYTRQILEGVEYLHQNDVIHRDIKGGNVMLMPNGVIKLIDFGCAKRLCINLSMGQSQILKSMKGTPYWMAPEVVNETGHGKKSDIWSVGCTVFEMATRKPPWADMNPMAAIFAIGSDKAVPQLPEKFSNEVRDFVNACLTKDQSKRSSASALLQCPFLRRRVKKNSSTC